MKNSLTENNQKKNNSKNYQVTREYKSIITSEEMLKRIIINHLNHEGLSKQQSVQGKMQSYQNKIL